MQTYKIVRPVNIMTGHVRLTKDQAKRRGTAVRQMGDSQVYAVLRPIQFKVGEHFGFDGDLSKTAVVCLEPVSANRQDKTESTRPGEIVSAIAQLEEDNEQHWTKAGKPEVRALESVLGYDITARERDTAWKQYQDVLASNPAED